MCEEVFLSEEQIQTRVAELARRLDRDYRDKDPLMICVLRGAVVFFSDLIRKMETLVEVDFVAVGSYGSGVKSSGKVDLMMDAREDLRGRHVILVEDIVDTGRTIHFLLSTLHRRNPASIRVCTLLSKPSRREMFMPLEYSGFVIPDQFVVGYGLDHGGRYRDLPHITTLGAIRSSQIDQKDSGGQ